MQSNYGEWNTALSVFVPLLYMSIATYFPLFRIKSLSILKLRPHKQTSAYCLLYNAVYACRLFFSLAYNFLSMLHVENPSEIFTTTNTSSYNTTAKNATTKNATTSIESGVHSILNKPAFSFALGSMDTFSGFNIVAAPLLFLFSVATYVNVSSRLLG